MNYKVLIIVFTFFLGLYSYTQQIIFDKVPEDFQLFPRDSNNKSSVVFSGTIIENNYNEFKVKTFKDGIFYGEKSLNIINKKFHDSITIEAGLFQFSFKLYSNKKNIEKLLFQVDNIVSGDAYIITGQSNSHGSSKKSTYISPFARSFGVKTGYETYTEEDEMVRWGLATGNCKDCKGDNWNSGYDGGWFVKNPFGIGVWGMELAKLLIEKHQIPVCIINGGSGSSTIEENMLHSEKKSLETSFGRLVYRVNQAQLKNNVKAIFYHQGESDTYLGLSFSSGRKRGEFTNYIKNFEVLNNDWLSVYKGLQKIYLFQIHPGCGGDFQSELRDIQNQISKKHDNVEIMSTTGVVGHDGCHFSFEGYKEFAKRIFPLVSRDFFGEKKSTIITPPQLLNAYYSEKKEITLTFDQPIVMEEFYQLNEMKYLMKNQFFFSLDKNKPSIYGVVNTLKVNNNQIIINLKSDKKYSAITWLPNKEYLNTKDIYNGPWIKGVFNKIGALSFDNRKIN